MKKFLAIVLVALMLFSLTACGTLPTSSSSNEPKVKNVENEKTTITINQWNNDGKETQPIQREGIYSGEVINGIPNGKGKFTAENDDAVAWTYDGLFVDGLFNGDGDCVWEDGSYAESGNYVNGTFTPTKAQLYTTLRYTGLADYTIEKSSQDFINENESLFPCTTDQDKANAESLTDESIVYKQITKSVSSYGGKMIHAASLRVIQIFEKYAYGHTITYMLAADDDVNIYYICYDGSLPNIYEDSVIDVYALTLANASFDNVSGGTTNTIVFAGSIINLIK